jgi:hypothetical protein
LKTPTPLFPTITAADWRAAIHRGRVEGNAILGKIRRAMAKKFPTEGAAPSVFGRGKQG